MQLIDFHTHIYPPAVAAKAMAAIGGMLEPGTDGTACGLMESMDKYGVDKSVILALVNKPAKSRSVNEWVLSEGTERLIPVGSVHPMEENPAETVDWLADSGVPGIKVHPEYQDFRFPDSRFFPLWEKISDRGLFLITHAGSDIKFTAPFRSNPAEILELHRRFPRLKLVASHFGSMDMWDEVEALLLGENIWLDLAMIAPKDIPPRRLASMIRRHGIERVVWGTDSPWQGQEKSIDFISSLPLPSGELEMIFAGNAAELLNLN